jgi:hypothetical protein
MFDSLKAVKKLEEVGIPRAQAEAYVLILMDAFELRHATKKDLNELKAFFMEYFDKIVTGMK